LHERRRFHAAAGGGFGFKRPGESQPFDVGGVYLFQRAEAGLARISHRVRRIGAPNQRKLFCDNDFALI